MLIDSHAHLADPKIIQNFDEYRNNYLSSNVGLVLDIGCGIESSKTVKENANKYGEVFYTVGCHPDEAGSVNADAINKLKELSFDKKCLAIGEIGLDYHYLSFDKEVQKKAFEMQLALAIELDKPVIVHSRDAWLDTLNILKAYSNNLKKGFLMHCYSGSKEMAKILLDMGAYFALGGVITFKNAKKDDVIKSIPMDRIFCETDCPFMAPTPHRGEVNQPSFVKLVYEKIASVYGVELNVLETQIESNFKKFFM